MKKLILASLLFTMVRSAVAGWYQVINYIGQIGPNSVHFSIQKYSFGPGTTVEGSYYYDKYLSPIPLYGLENDDKSLLLCEVHTPAEYDKALIHGFKDGSYAARCPIHLSLTDEGAVGRWSDPQRTYAISLKRNGSLDNRNTAQIFDAVEIPFWGQTEKYAFVGL